MNIKNLVKFSVVAILSTTLVACGGGNSNEVENTEVEQTNTITSTSVKTEEVENTKTHDELASELGTEFNFDIKNVEQSYDYMNDFEIEMLSEFQSNFDKYGITVYDHKLQSFYFLPTDEITINAYISTIMLNDEELNTHMNNLIESLMETTRLMKISTGKDYGFVILNPHNENRALLITMSGLEIYNAFEK